MSQNDEVLAALVAALGDQMVMSTSGLELQKAIADRVIDTERAVGFLQAEQIRATERFTKLIVAGYALSIVAVLIGVFG